MHLVGTHFSDLSKLTFYLFENVEKINIYEYNFWQKLGKSLISLNLVLANKSVLKLKLKVAT